MSKSKVIGTAYKKPDGYSGLAFASGRGAIYDAGGTAPTLASCMGG